MDFFPIRVPSWSPKCRPCQQIAVHACSSCCRVQDAHRAQIQVRRLVWEVRNNSQLHTAPPRLSLVGGQPSHDDRRVVQHCPNSQRSTARFGDSMAYLILVGSSQPINIQNRALGDISPGRPLNLASCGSASLGPCTSVRNMSTDTNYSTLRTGRYVSPISAPLPMPAHSRNCVCLPSSRRVRLAFPNLF